MADNLQVEKISQLPQNDSALGSNDEFIVNREISPGVVKTRKGKYGSIFGPLISSIQTALSWIASPLSASPGQQASLDVNGKIFVPATSLNFFILGTQSSPQTISNTSAETIYPTNLQISPSDNVSGSKYDLLINFSKGPSGHSSTIRIYLNTVNNLTGSPVKIMEYVSGFNNTTSYTIFQAYLRNAIGLVVPRDINAVVGSNLTNFSIQTLLTTTPISFSSSNTWFLIITTQMNVNNSSETLQFAKLCRIV